MSTQVAFFGITHAHAARVKKVAFSLEGPTAVIHLNSGEFAQGGYLDLHLASPEEAQILLDAAQAALYLLTTEDVTP